MTLQPAALSHLIASACIQLIAEVKKKELKEAVVIRDTVEAKPTTRQHITLTAGFH